MREQQPAGPVLAAAHALVQGLRPSGGSNWIGFCPIHGETKGASKPSFSFNEATGQWNCFTGCGAGGLPQLLRKLHKSDEYIDRTMERLRPHLKPVRLKKESAARGGLFTTDYPLPERILGMFEHAPVDLLNLGYDEQVLFDNDVGFDTERERVTYALRDLSGQLAGIVGKPVDPGEGGKYRVYEQEIVDMGFRGYHFKNRRFLWGWEKVYPAVYYNADPSPVCVTEGYKARLWLIQHGFPLTVALMGTGMSETQQMFLERLGTRIILCLDNDPAGRLGTSKISYKLRGLDVAVMRYPFPEAPKLQPDDLTQEELGEAIHSPFTVRHWRRFYNEHWNP